ncbi:hypothetical protein HDV00_007616 [Rhizophlyctis rosea]|nr:hypothetical protein HDV00_007616 [Rhizophlyctis rosea]
MSSADPELRSINAHIRLSTASDPLRLSTSQPASPIHFYPLQQIENLRRYDSASSVASLNSTTGSLSEMESPSANSSESLERALFQAVHDGDREALASLLGLVSHPDTATDSTLPSKPPTAPQTPTTSTLQNEKLTLLLQILLTTSLPNPPNTPTSYTLDPEITPIQHLLLGPSLQNLNLIQLAVLLGEEDIALDILNFVAYATEAIESRKILYEFMGRVFGNGNGVLHLASFQGMSEVVRRMLELGATAVRKNECGNRPVDCTDDEVTREVFLTVVEAEPRQPQRPIIPPPEPTRRLSDDISTKASNQRNNTLALLAAATTGKGHVKSFSLDDADATPSLRTRLAASSLARDSEASGRPRSQSSLKEIDVPGTEMDVVDGGNIGEKGAVDSGDSDKADGVPSLPSTTSLTATNTPPPPQHQHLTPSQKTSKPRLPKFLRKVTFDAPTLILDICHFGDPVDNVTLPTLRSYLGLPPLSTTTPPQQQQASININTITTPQQHLTPLHLASSHGHIAIVRLLLQLGAEVNVRDREGWTPLHCACAEGWVDIVGVLGWCWGRAGAVEGEGEEGEEWYAPPDGPIDLEPVNGDGELPEDVVLEERRGEVLRVLKDLKSRHPPRTPTSPTSSANPSTTTTSTHSLANPSTSSEESDSEDEDDDEELDIEHMAPARMPMRSASISAKGFGGVGVPGRGGWVEEKVGGGLEPSREGMVGGGEKTGVGVIRRENGDGKGVEVKVEVATIGGDVDVAPVSEVLSMTKKTDREQSVVGPQPSEQQSVVPPSVLDGPAPSSQSQPAQQQQQQQQQPTFQPTPDTAPAPSHQPQPDQPTPRRSIDVPQPQPPSTTRPQTTPSKFRSWFTRNASPSPPPTPPQSTTPNNPSPPKSSLPTPITHPSRAYTTRTTSAPGPLNTSPSPTSSSSSLKHPPRTASPLIQLNRSASASTLLSGGSTSVNRAQRSGIPVSVWTVGVGGICGRVGWGFTERVGMGGGGVGWCGFFRVRVEWWEGGGRR